MTRPLLIVAGLAACTPSTEQLLEDTEVSLLDLGDAPAGASAVYTVDADASPQLYFEANGLFGVRANGTWSRYNVRVADLGEGPESYRIDFAAETDSVVTGNDRLDEHIRTPDFFDVQGHPRASFTSTDVRALPEGDYEVMGDMTLRGTTRPIQWRSTIEIVDDRVHATARIPFSRWDFGLYAEDSEEPGDDGADDEVVVTYDVWLERA